MILFSNDKEIIFKITNAVLLIWLVGAIVFFVSTVINIAVQPPKYDLKEYKAMNCEYYKGDSDLTEKEHNENCERNYNNQSYSEKQDNYYDKISLYSSLANIVIVGSVMYFLNRKVTVTSKSTKKDK